MSLRFSGVYMMLWLMACFGWMLEGRNPASNFLVPLDASLGTEHVLNFCSDDEDSATLSLHPL